MIIIIIISKTILLTISYYLFHLYNYQFHNIKSFHFFKFISELWQIPVCQSDYSCWAWKFKPNDKIIKSITSNLNIVLELSKNDADV